jgi:hypothetical protein
MEQPWRGWRPKPKSMVRLRDGRLGLRIRLDSGEMVTMPLGQATFRMLFDGQWMQLPRADE